METALICLALNMYHEARGEPLAGRIAVTQVVLNRTKSQQFPNTVCEVVKQARYYNNTLILHKCQFSWYCDGKSDKPTDQIEWEKALNLSTSIILNNIPDITEGALYYHATSVSPYWAEHYTPVVTINNHIFYH